MKIAHVIKVKKLSSGDRVLVVNADEEPRWVRVLSCEEQDDPDWYGVELEGTNEMLDEPANARVVVWK